MPLHIRLPLAHALFQQRMASMDQEALSQHRVQAPPASGPLFYSPDLTGALLRESMSPSDQWKKCANSLGPALTTAAGMDAGAAGDESNSKLLLQQRAGDKAANERARRVGTVGGRPNTSGRGRKLQCRTTPPETLHPVSSIVGPHAQAPEYTRAPSVDVWPIMSLRSAHLPGDYSAQARERYGMDECPQCGEVCVQPNEDLPACERRWRHIQHALAMCGGYYSDHRPSLSELHADLLAVAHENEEEALLHAVNEWFAGEHEDWHATREGALCVLLDPAAACLHVGASRSVAVQVQRLCSAYILSVSADVTGETLYVSESLRRRLPSGSQLATALYTMQRTATLDSDSDAEVWAGDSDSERPGRTASGVVSMPCLSGAPMMSADVESEDELPFDAYALAVAPARTMRRPSKRLCRRAEIVPPARCSHAAVQPDSDDEVVLPCRLPMVPLRPRVADTRPSKRVMYSHDRAGRVQSAPVSAAPAAPPPAPAGAGEADAPPE